MRLADAVDEPEGFASVDIGCRKAPDLLKRRAPGRLFDAVPPPLELSFFSEQHDHCVRDRIAIPPLPTLRRVASDVAQPSRAARLARHAAAEFTRESVNNVLWNF